MRRLWQRGMIALARSPVAKSWAQGSRAGTVLATRYVAGANVADAVASANAMWADHRLLTSLFYLGEYVDTPELVAANVAAKIDAARELGRAGLDVHVSVDPTQIGQCLDPQMARENAFAIAEAIATASHRHPGFHALMLDMEDESVIDATIALHNDIKAAGLPVAITLQAYLRRTPEDTRALIATGASVRMVKGAFAANAQTAHTGRDDIKSASRHLIDLMMSQEARASGLRPVIATHDDALQAYAYRDRAFCSARSTGERHPGGSGRRNGDDRIRHHWNDGDRHAAPRRPAQARQFVHSLGGADDGAAADCRARAIQQVPTEFADSARQWARDGGAHGRPDEHPVPPCRGAKRSSDEQYVEPQADPAGKASSPAAETARTAT